MSEGLKENKMKLMTITIEVDDMLLSSRMTINKEAFEKYKDDYGLSSPEKLAEQAEPVLNAASELTFELGSKYMYIRKSKGESVDVIELHRDEIELLMKVFGIEKSE